MSEFSRPVVAFDFVRPTAQRIAEVEAGKAPRESLLGYFQLRERGWQIIVSDDRWQGRWGRLRSRLQPVCEIPSWGMIKSWRSAQLVLVTTRISLVLAVTAKLLGRKLVFLDAMCGEVPRRFWRRWPVKAALLLSDACIGLSPSQARHWARRLGISERRFNPVYYGIDSDFYRPRPAASAADDRAGEPYLLSVGRDPRRDFATLIAAAEELGIGVKLVTRPYLLPDGAATNPRVQVLDDLTYDDLFALYAGAAAVVVPVKQNTTFMSGIRATLEAMSLGVPVVASRSPGMQDYFTDGAELLYFEPEHQHGLEQALRSLLESPQLAGELVGRARSKLVQQYQVGKYADAVEQVLCDVARSAGCAAEVGR